MPSLHTYGSYLPKWQMFARVIDQLTHLEFIGDHMPESLVVNDAHEDVCFKLPTVNTTV